MKFLPSILLALLLFAGCRKNSSCGENIAKGLKGTWELRSVTGGMAPGGNYSPGNGNMVRFEDFTFEKIRNGQVLVTGTYSVSRGVAPQTGQMMDKIIYAGGYEEFYEISGKYLILYSGIVAADGTISQYEKL